MFIIIDDSQNAYCGETLEEAFEYYTDTYGESYEDLVWYEAKEIEVKIKPVTVTKPQVKLVKPSSYSPTKGV